MSQVFFFPFGTDAENALPLAVRVQNVFKLINNVSAGRKIGAFYFSHQGFDFAFGIFDQVQQRVADFTQIVRRDVGGHADGNAGRTVAQQIRHH